MLLWALGLGCERAGESHAPQPERPAESPAIRGSASPSAQWEVVESLREDRAAPRHASDGGGRAWLEDDPNGRHRVRVGEPGRFPIVFEAGPEGVAVGGAVFFQVSPFWGWSGVQTEDPTAPGYTRVTSELPGLELETRIPDPYLLEIEIGGRRLAAGEQIRIVYGDGAVGALVDRFAEREAPLYVAVDGDGDGVRRLLETFPRVDVGPGPASRLQLSLPGSARPGEKVSATLALLDASGSAGVDWAGPVNLAVAGPATLERASLELTAADAGLARVGLVVGGEGVVRLRAETPDGLAAESNPLLSSTGGTPLLFGDLHGHTHFSDGTGTPEDYFRYARDVAGLDVAAVTDHDHWGTPFLDETPALWQRTAAAVKAFHARKRFVALLGYEWTSWLHGHRHVVYFSDEGEILSSIAPETESPAQLWDALRGTSALTFAHHSAGGPVATNWSYPPDPELEPVTEVISVHGSSEALDSPLLIYSPIPGNFVRDVLDTGARLGFVGSGDSHDGHPGLTHLASGGLGGLVGIYAAERSREAVRSALQARAVYATSGPRIVLELSVGGVPMGGVLRDPDTLVALEISVAAPEVVQRIDVVRSGSVTARIPGDGRRDLRAGLELDGLRAGEYVYVRVIQEDSGLAFSSPVFVE